MRLRYDTYKRVNARAVARTVVFTVFGSILLVIGCVGLLTGVLICFDSTRDRPEILGGLLTIGIGLVFGTGGALLFWRGRVARRVRLRLRDFVAFAQAAPALERDDLARALGIPAFDAGRLMVDAVAAGILEDDVPPAAVVAAAPARSTPSPAAATALADANARTMRAPSTPPPARGSGRTSAPDGEGTVSIGTVLNGTYRIERFLGAGGMGAVYAAKHLRTGQLCAVKTLRADEALTKEAVDRFEREATMASGLGHPSIVGVHDFNKSDEGVHYLVMDLLEGEGLDRRLLRVGSLPWDEARRIALQIGGALVVAHEAGILHRDLKPGNIFLAKDAVLGERAVLVDFGLVKRMDEGLTSRITSTGAALGTPMYMSPEQARGEQLDGRSDVFSLASVVFEMAAGKPPLVDGTPATLFLRLLTAPPPKASAIAARPLPASVDAVLEHALAKDVTERTASMRAFVTALEEVGAAGAAA